MSDSTTGKHFWISIAAWLIFSLAFAIKPTFGQIFPVQANINVTPPYTAYLSHYTAPDQQRIMASVLLHDPIVSSLDVRFRFTIEGAGIRIYTNPGWMPAPVTLHNGITEIISADVIAEYFRPQNVVVEGINPQELFNKGKLPEGFYQFKIEVLEYQRGVPISNVGRTAVWLMLSEPPRIVFPMPNQKVNATNPQMLNFTWVPGSASSPLSVLSTMYEFTMVELMGDVDPTVALTTASDAIKFTHTQQQTTLLYGPGEPQLIPGKRYAYRVRAYNTDGYEIFKNNGYSEVQVFQFGDGCNAPTMFTLKDETQNTFNIDVISDPSSTAWQAQFRENGDETGQWSELKAEARMGTKTVKGLKASTTYQVQVKSLCGTASSSYTTPQTITTKDKDTTQRSCDNSVSPFVVSQAEPLQQLKPNDIFLAALMPIKVTEVTSQGGGKFTGKGIATVPLFSAGLAVHFTDISINELMQLTAGEVIVERNDVNVTLFGDTNPTGNDSTTGNGTATDTTGNGGWPEITDTINISSDIDSVVVVNDTTVWVYTSGGGDPVIVDMGGSDCLLIVPADGNMDNAQVVYNGAAQPYSAGSSNSSDTDGQYTGFRARFTPAPNTQYGFDSLRVQAYANQYNDLEIDGKTYKLPWKALPVNIPDPVTLHVRRSADSYPYSDLKVGILGGNDLLPAAGANTATQTYNLTGTTDGDQYAVVAKYTQDGKNKYVGGLWAATYQKKEHKLYIVPLPNVEVPAATIGQLQNGLTQIYSQAVVSWTVQPLNGFTGVELGDNGLDWADKDMLSSYNAEMNSVISAFKDWKTDADPDAYYLFVVPQFSEGGVEGFMPRNRRFGFVTLSQLDASLVAHEIGHGAFNLRHTFPGVPQGSTDNLMDYTDGKTSLLKPQWDLIHNPETTTGLFDDMEDGAYIIDRWKLVRQYIDEFNGKTGTARTNYKFTYDYSKVAENFSTEAINQVNNLLTEYLKENDEPVFLVLELFTHTEEKDVADIKSIVEQECLDILKGYPNTVLIPVIGCQLVNEGNAPIGDVEFYICKKVSEQKISQIGSYDDNWADLEKENVSEEVAEFLEFLQSSPVFNDENCFELTYEELGISSVSELNPNDVKEWVSAFAEDNGVSIDYSYTGYPVVNNSEIPTASLNQPENSNADINIAVHFDDDGKKIIICHHYKVGAIVIPSVTVSGDPVQETTVDEIVGLSKVYAGKALDYAKSGGEKMQALFNSAVKGVVAAKTWTKTICDKMEVPQPVWNDMDNKEAFDRSPVHVEPILSGVGDGTFEELKSIPELITLALDVAFDKQIRNSLWESLKSISWEDVKNMPVKMVKDKVAVYERGGSIAKHEGGKDGVQVASMVLGFGSLKKGKELAEEVGEQLGKSVTDIVKKLPKSIVDDLSVLSEKTFGKIIKELGDDPKLLEELLNNPKLAKAWTHHKVPLPQSELDDLVELYTKSDVGDKVIGLIEEASSKKVFMQLMDAARKYQKEIIERWTKDLPDLVEEVSFDVILDGKTYRTRLDGIAERAGKFIVVEAKMGEAVFSEPQKMFMKALKEGVGEIKPIGNNATRIFGEELTGTNVRDIISKQIRLNNDVVDIATATVRGLK